MVTSLSTRKGDGRNGAIKIYKIVPCPEIHVEDVTKCDAIHDTRAMDNRMCTTQTKE